MALSQVLSLADDFFDTTTFHYFLFLVVSPALSLDFLLTDDFFDTTTFHYFLFSVVSHALSLDFLLTDDFFDTTTFLLFQIISGIRIILQRSSILPSRVSAK